MKKVVVSILAFACVAAQDPKPEIPQLKMEQINLKGDPIKFKGRTNLPPKVEMTFRIIPQRHELIHGKTVQILTSIYGTSISSSAMIRKGGKFSGSIRKPDSSIYNKLDVVFNPYGQKTADSEKAAAKFQAHEVSYLLVMADPDKFVKNLDKERPTILSHISDFESLFKRIKQEFDNGTWEDTFEKYLKEARGYKAKIEKEMRSSVYVATLGSIFKAYDHMDSLVPDPGKPNIDPGSEAGGKMMNEADDFPLGAGDKFLLMALEAYIGRWKRSAARERIIASLHLSYVLWDQAIRYSWIPDMQPKDLEEAIKKWEDASDASMRNHKNILKDRPRNEDQWSESDQKAEEWTTAIDELLAQMKDILGKVMTARESEISDDRETELRDEEDKARAEHEAIDKFLRVVPK